MNKFSYTNNIYHTQIDKFINNEYKNFIEYLKKQDDLQKTFKSCKDEFIKEFKSFDNPKIQQMVGSILMYVDISKITEKMVKDNKKVAEQHLFTEYLIKEFLETQLELNINALIKNYVLENSEVDFDSFKKLYNKDFKMTSKLSEIKQ